MVVYWRSGKGVRVPDWHEAFGEQEKERLLATYNDFLHELLKDRTNVSHRQRIRDEIGRVGGEICGTKENHPLQGKYAVLFKSGTHSVNFVVDFLNTTFKGRVAKGRPIDRKYRFSLAKKPKREE